MGPQWGVGKVLTVCPPGDVSISGALGVLGPAIPGEIQHSFTQLGHSLELPFPSPGPKRPLKQPVCLPPPAASARPFLRLDHAAP